MSKPPTWTGWDFSPDGLLDSVDDGTLVVEVDGVTHTVQLDADLTSPTSAVSLLNERLAGVATVSLNPDEQFVIRCGTPQHGISSKKMALVTSDYGIMCYLRTKRP